MSGFVMVPFCKDLDKNLSRFRVGDVVVVPYSDKSVDFG